MTGFGTATAETDKITITIDIKSLNSKFMDATIRLPRNYSDKDFDVRNLVSKVLDRGKVNLAVDIQSKGELKAKVSVNKDLVKAYYNDLLAAADYVKADTKDLFKMALNMPDVMSSEDKQTDNTEEWDVIKATIEKALAGCDQFRQDEGAVLSGKLKEYIESIRTSLGQIMLQDPVRLQNVREKLRKQVSELVSADGYDKNRFEQELIYYIEKLDVKEEFVRLENHLNYFIETMEKADANGKKLGFIAQEIGREINTIGSKANDAQIQRLVVNMKEELEKIKEQSLNVL